MFKKYVRWVIALLALAGIAFGVWRWQTSHAAPEVTYRSAPVEKRRIVAKVTASGTLQATVTVQVGAQVSGRIAKLGADFNSVVKKGEIIAKIDPQLFIAAVEQARANHLQAKASLVKAVAQQRDAEMSQMRTKSLTDQGLASATELQAADTNVAVMIAQTELAKANLEQAVAALNQAQVNLSYTDIPAPIDGVVISRSVDVGQTVASSFSAPVLFTIAEDLKTMQVHTSVAEGDVGRLQPGMETWFTVDAFPGQRFKGKVSQIRNAATTVQNVVTYDAVIDVNNDDLRLRPGMTATTTIVFAEKSEALAIPNTAIRFKPPSEVASAIASASAPSVPAASLSVTSAGGEASATASASASASAFAPSGEPTKRVPRMRKSFGNVESAEKTIYVLRSGRPEPIEVKTGLTDGTITEVVSGDLKEGDQVVIEANVAGKPTSSAGAPGQPPRMGRMF
jgi:HlyD family secretion protein